jgi:hypothetical protein
MNKTKLGGKFGIMLCSVLLGYTTYAQPSVSVGVSVPVPSVELSLPSVEIHAESDFYEPLTPHGEWVVVGSHGRCWRPARVEASWRPYCNGSWQHTDVGWYWVSDEPWAWATYHYGRWDYGDQYGWYWVPQTQWAPAWVSWHSGGGYVGWAPLLPSVRISASGFIGFNVSVIPPRAYVFVEQGNFLSPIRPTTVVINNTTIINKTTHITNTKIVNNVVINGGPSAAVIEKASGRKIQAVPVKELRQKQESAVAVKQNKSNSGDEKKAQATAPGVVEPRAKKNVAGPEPTKVQKPAARESAPPVVKDREVRSEKQRPAPTAPELKSEPKSSGKKALRPAGEKTAEDKDREKKPKQ